MLHFNAAAENRVADSLQSARAHMEVAVVEVDLLDRRSGENRRDLVAQRHVRLLGLLPPQPLVMFQRTIYPMAAWIRRQKRFYPNWEVAKVVEIPLPDLLNPANYGRYRLRLETPENADRGKSMRDFPCFRLQTAGKRELLWGATYRIITQFLNYVFNFIPPPLEKLPVTNGVLDANYLTGQK